LALAREIPKNYLPNFLQILKHGLLDWAAQGTAAMAGSIEFLFIQFLLTYASPSGKPRHVSKQQVGEGSVL
jgi:hypothetical protein